MKGRPAAVALVLGIALAACERTGQKTAAPPAQPSPAPVVAPAPPPPKRPAPSTQEIAPAPPPAAAANPPEPATPEVVQRMETDSGLIIEDLKIGEGPEAQKFDTVTVNYVGTLADGREFDRSRRPTTFLLTQMVKGWQEGIPGMKVGGKRRLIVPPELGYGSRGRPPLIPPDSMLIFEIELLELPE